MTGSGSDVQRLLWRLADQYTPVERCGPYTVRPTWFDHVGNLEVAGGPVIWETPWRTDGGFMHELAAGSHPVHVGGYARTRDRWNPDSFRYTASMVVIMVAEPERIAEADWDVEGYDDIHHVEDYAVLWGEEAMRASLPLEDGVPSFIPDVRERIEAKGPFLRRDNWVEAVLDDQAGLNAFVLPIATENLTGYEIVDDEENVLCLVLVACDW
ncbi:hypothetical protein ACFFQW_31345 [Umezawaea endophytica]|uniref:Uncharacterized protein n=1 Tax=Umezawaea endophytica TaxID=1654476 RepID=A0A9X2VFY8_9PSEU|nr:hypothetical protein [Umezawaea endophytica]MCS7475357.1 hypothetical protein [Umezawaea endophytica]